MVWGPLLLSSSLFVAFMYSQPGPSLVFVVQKKFSSFSESPLEDTNSRSLDGALCLLYWYDGYRADVGTSAQWQKVWRQRRSAPTQLIWTTRCVFATLVTSGSSMQAKGRHISTFTDAFTFYMWNCDWRNCLSILRSRFCCCPFIGNDVLSSVLNRKSIASKTKMKSKYHETTQ